MLSTLFIMFSFPGIECLAFNAHFLCHHAQGCGEVTVGHSSQMNWVDALRCHYFA